MANKTEHLRLGIAGEDAAAKFLARKGFRVIVRNWRPCGTQKGLELDIVARHEEVLVFVEVKTRNISFVPTHEALTPQKKARLVRAARQYLAAHELWDIPCRFDLICVERSPDGRLNLEHHTHVIELGHAVDSRNAPWQP